MSHSDGDAAGASPPPPPAAAPAPASARQKPIAYAPMGVLRGGECGDLLALVSAVARPLEEAVAGFRARISPERRLRFGSAVSFVLEVRGFFEIPRYPPRPRMPSFSRRYAWNRGNWIVGCSRFQGMLGPKQITNQASIKLCYLFFPSHQDKTMLQPAERLIAFAILHQGYSSKLANPFVPLLINAACDETSEKAERVFLQLLLSSTDGDNNEVLKQSAIEYLNGSDYASQVLLPREELEKQCSYDASSLQSSFRGSSVRNAIPDPDVFQSSGSSSEVSPTKPNRDNMIASLLQQSSLKGLPPQWIRPPPPRLEILEGELQWLNLDNSHELLWDGSMCADTSRGSVIRDLVEKACKAPLAPAQQEVLSAILFSRICSC
nr:unnamed protein product [Digitaria exilis]